MNSSVFVADASPLIALAQIGRLALLRALSTEVMIPPGVAGEVAPTLPERPFWMVERPLRRPIEPRIAFAALDAGESMAIGLALEIGAAGVILDDRGARRVAEEVGLHVVGTLGVLRLAKRRGLIPAVRPEIDALVSVRFHFTRRLAEQVLRDAGELD